MRILYVAFHFFPDSSAATTVNQEIAKGLCNRGHKVTLLGPNCAFADGFTDGSLGFLKGCDAVRYGPRLRRLPASTIGFMLLLLRAIPLALKTNVLLCECHNSHAASLSAAITSIISRRPLVIKVHDLLYQYPPKIVGYKQFLMNFALRWPTCWSIRRAKLILVPGDELVAVCQRMYGLQTDRVAVSYNGVDTKKFSRRNRSRSLRGKIGSRHVVIFSGRIVPDRGIDTLLQAVPLIRDKIPDVKVLVAGPPVSSVYLRRLRQLANALRISNCIKFIDVSPSAIRPYLASADVGVGELRQRVSSYGATPLKIVEYMASGCIVVACRNTVSSRLISDRVNGFLTEPGDYYAVAKNILQVFSNANFSRKIRTKARQTAVETFSWNVIVSKLERILYEAQP